ncbi:MAG: type IV pilus secretin PilQ [Candidatus Nitricoxidivorans perseverans]|uniref:Type IV pilus secretin PilQ n=1 Tax=Candidatus Nitricoxidivorans perseverans TaxID=2975601 RepID=A0AA49IY44_9PROT|nr:MAG: type IV pilus secretin PilQ [Candidatus Nitricoxidivorans perseverans]
MNPNTLTRRCLAAWATLLAAVLLPALPATAQIDTAGTRNSIEALTVSQQGGNTVIKVVTGRALDKAPATFSVANPPRIVFDFQDTANKLGRTVQQFNEGYLRSANIIQTDGRTRLVLNLNKFTTHETRQEGASFYISLLPNVIGEAAGQSGATQHFPETKAAPERRTLRDIGFRRGKGGEGLVTVEMSDPGTGVDVRQQGSTLVVEFQKVSLPEHLRRRLDVTDFATPITTVSTAPQGENVRIAITPKGLWEHTAYQSDNQFVVEVKPVKEDPSKIFQSSKQGYQGDKVSLNFQNIPLRELLHVFADITNFNIVISDTVMGNVSLRLNEVPWDQALEIVLQQKGLAMRKNGNVIWIAPQDELAAKEKLELESKQQISELEPVRTESFQLNYQKAEALQKLLTDKDQRVLSKRGSAVIDARTNKVFVSDTPSRLDDVRRLIAEIDIPARQVMIEARIVEAENTFSKALGVRLGAHDHKGLDIGHRVLGTNSPRWGIAGSTNDAYVHLTDNFTQTFYPGQYSNAPSLPATGYYSGTQIKKEGTVSDIGASQFVNLPAPSRSGTPGAISFTLFNSQKTQLLSLELSALEADGKGKFVSNPRVVTADKVEALIEQGTEIPYLCASSSGAVSVCFRKAMLALKVRPQITPDGRVMMSLDINKDAPSSLPTGGAGVAIDSKHVKTDVLVENGGTVVIGGIYTQDERNESSRIPVLGDLPYVGFMFRNTNKINDKKELLIFITPKIISEALSLR